MLVAVLLACWSTAVLNKAFCEKSQAMAPQGVIEKQWKTQKSILVAGLLACWSTAVLNKPFCEKSQAMAPQGGRLRNTRKHRNRCW